MADLAKPAAHLSPRLLELLEDELEERKEERDYNFYVSTYIRPAPPRKPASAIAPPVAAETPPAPPAPADVPLASAIARPEYLTTREVAALLGVSVKGLEGMRARGAGPKYVRIGGRIRYHRDELRGPK